MEIISINPTDRELQVLPPPQISPLADVDPAAEIGDGCVIGPFCVIGPRAKLGQRNTLMNNVSILGKVTIGDDNRISPGAVIGGEPQDISYSGTETEVIVGDRNIIRENVTFNRASEKEDGTTIVGSDSYFMACSHVAHDCKLGDRIVLGQGSMLGGHVHVHSFATISGCVAVSHYVSIGSYTFIGGSSRALQDITPFMLADGNPARPRCINIVGLKRNNFDRQAIKAIDETFRLLYRSRVGLDNAIEILRSKDLLIDELQYCLDFIRRSQAGRHGRGREKRKTAA